MFSVVKLLILMSLLLKRIKDFPLTSMSFHVKPKLAQTTFNILIPGGGGEWGSPPPGAPL